MQYQQKIHHLRRKYGRGHLPSVDNDLMMEKIQKYLPDPLQYHPRYELPIHVDNKGNHLIARSRSQTRSQRSDPANQLSPKSRSNSSGKHRGSGARESLQEVRSSRSRERHSRSNSQGRRKQSKERAPINLLITNNQYDGSTFRSGTHLPRPQLSNQMDVKKQISWEDRHGQQVAYPQIYQVDDP